MSRRPLSAAPIDRPNIVLILTDDQGYADISLNPQHAPEVSTPNMDALAEEGVVFSRGYTSGHVCSPTRAGIMIGGYQQRVGVYTAGQGGLGFDPNKKIFPGYLPNDYVSTAIGKWHLGLDDDFPELKWHAMNRGFDECYKFMGRGAHSYFNLRSDTEGKFSGAIYRNQERINDSGYLTNRLTQEAVEFIDRNKHNPFFLYLAYNAVHAPAEAPQEDIEFYQEKFPQLSPQRAVLMAMLNHLDDGVGAVVDKLKQEGIFDNTILFFLTDNGGAKAMSADNTPLRGFKQTLDEGGIRTPFIVSWPAKFRGGRTIDTPVISFDILPTALDAIGKLTAEDQFDGKSLLPLLTGESVDHHETLFWSKGEEDEWAVRRSDWKLHWTKGQFELVNLTEDPSETRNLANMHEGKVSELRVAFDDWIATMAEPIRGGAKRKDRPLQTVADNIDLSHWKLTLPIDGGDKNSPLEIAATELNNDFKNSYFQVDANGLMVFWCPVNGSTTEGTEYPRCELREMLEPGNPRRNWEMPGTHVMQARCRLIQVPSNPKIVIGQIHSYTGNEKPLVKLQYFKGRLEALVKLSPNRGTDKKLTFPGVDLNADVDWSIKLSDGILSVSVNGLTQTENVVKNDKQWAEQTFYFKAGVYPQDNQGDASEGARVSFSHLQVSHDNR